MGELLDFPSPRVDIELPPGVVTELELQELAETIVECVGQISDGAEHDAPDRERLRIAAAVALLLEAPPVSPGLEGMAAEAAVMRLVDAMEQFAERVAQEDPRQRAGEVFSRAVAIATVKSARMGRKR